MNIQSQNGFYCNTISSQPQQTQPQAVQADVIPFAQPDPSALAEFGQLHQLFPDFTGASQGSTLDFNDNNSITQRMQQLAPADPELRQLIAQAAYLEPDSAQAQQVNARIAAQWTGSPNDLQEFQALNGLRQLNTMTAGLNNVSRNLDPNSAQYQQLQAQLTAINEKRNSFIQNIQQLETQPTQSNSTNFNDNNSIAQRMQQLVPADPRLQQLFAQAANLDPSSAQAQQVNAQITAQWSGSPDDLKEFQALSALSQLNNMTAGLKNSARNLDPNSSQYQQIQTQIAAIDARRNDLIQQL